MVFLHVNSYILHLHSDYCRIMAPYMIDWGLMALSPQYSALKS